MMTKSASLAQNRWARLTCLITVLSLGSSLAAGRVAAQTPSILVVGTTDVQSELRDDVVESLSALGDIVSADRYLAAARAQGLAPESATALERLGREAQAHLIVLLTRTRSKLEVAFVAGASGARLFEESLYAPSRKPELSARARRRLAAWAGRALAKIEGTAGAALPADSEAQEAPEPAARQDAPQPRAAAPEPPAPASASQPEAASADDVPRTASEDTPSEEARSDEEPARLSLHFHAGAGVGMHKNRVPALGESPDLDPGSTTTVYVGLVGDVRIDDHWFVSGMGQLLSSIGLHTTQNLPGIGRDTTLSATNFTFGVAPGYRLNGPLELDVRLLVGWTFRGLQPTDREVFGTYLHGLVLRPELRLPIAGEWVMIRLAPELVLPVHVEALPATSTSPVSQVGTGFGFEVALEVKVTGPLHLGVEYRQSSISAASTMNVSLIDYERYIMGRLALWY
jgi:hypothetical protein